MLTTLLRSRFALLGLGAGLIFLLASILSLAIAMEQYRILIGLLLLGLLTVLPVQMSLGLFAVTVPFDTVLVIGDSTSVSAVLGGLTGITLVVYGLLSGRQQTPPRTALWWGLFVAWSAASVLWAVNPEIAMQRLPTVLTSFALYVAVVSFRISRRELHWIFVLTVIGGLVAALISMRQFAENVTLSGRATLTFGPRQANPNDFAASLLLPVALSLAGFSTFSERWKKAVMLAAGLLLGAGVLLTMSRGALIALVVTVGVSLVRPRIRWRALTALLIVAVALAFLPRLFLQRLESSASSRGQGRFDILIVGAAIVQAHPIVGAGLENFIVEYARYAGKAPVFRGLDRPAHNVYMQVQAETGIIGLALFLFAAWQQMKRRKQFSEPISARIDYFGFALEAACWGMLAMGLSGSIHWNKPFWLAFTLLASAARCTQDELYSFRRWLPRQIRPKALVVSRS